MLRRTECTPGRDDCGNAVAEVGRVRVDAATDAGLGCVRAVRVLLVEVTSWPVPARDPSSTPLYRWPQTVGGGQ